MTEFLCLSLDLRVPSHCGVEVIDAIDHTQTHPSVGLLWTSDRPVAETST
jgi:hypothetical protein